MKTYDVVMSNNSRTGVGPPHLYDVFEITRSVLGWERRIYQFSLHANTLELAEATAKLRLTPRRFMMGEAPGDDHCKV